MAEPGHRSTYADHPDVCGVLPAFINRLPAHVSRLQELARAGNWCDLKCLCHQLKGTGKSYGFEPISSHAGAIEQAIEGSKEKAEILAEVEKLVRYMEGVEGFGGTRGNSTCK